MSIQTVNPATGKTIKNYEEMSSQDVDKIINETHHDYLQWRELSFAERAKKLHRVADLLQKNKTQYAKTMAQEMGKPISAGGAAYTRCEDDAIIPIFIHALIYFGAT